MRARAWLPSRFRSTLSALTLVSLVALPLAAAPLEANAASATPTPVTGTPTPTPTLTPTPTPGQVVTIRPSGKAGQAVDGPGYYQLSLRPGTSITLDALVSNASDLPANVRMVPVDATTGVFGGVSYNLPEAARRHVGAWINVQQTELPLAPHKGAVVGLSVTVPDGTPPGQYVGGLSAYVPAVAPSTGHFAITIQTRGVVAVEVTVPGPLTRRLTITGVHEERRPDSGYVVIDVKNSGNMLLKAAGTLLVTRPGDSQPLISGPVTLDTTVPHTAVHYPIRWMTSPPVGRYHAHVELAWRGGATSWDGDFNVTAAPAPTAQASGSGVFVAPLAAAATATPSARPAATDPSPSGVAWPFVAGLLALLLLLLILLARRRRER